MTPTTTKLHVRLLPSVDEGIREFLSRKGDLSNHVLQMFDTVDLETVRLPDMRAELARDTESTSATTIDNFPDTYHRKLKRTAAARGCSMNALINGGIKEYIAILKKATKKKT
jgi:hypothetical protein